MMREDPEIGLVRTCPGCGEEWPFDGEFWHLKDGRLNSNWPHRCIACCLEYFAERRRLRMVFRRAGKVVDPPVEGRCNARLLGGRCGRWPDHAYSHRSSRAMAAESFRKRAA